MYPDKIIHGGLRRLASRDAETAHNAAINVMRLAQQSPWLLKQIAEAYAPRKPVPVEIAGIKLPHRVGAAAGLDKQGLVLPFLQAMGFGFTEVGSILPRPQLGKPRPRMFTLPGHRAAINRFGFNSDGVDVIAPRIERVFPSLDMPLGMSLGTNQEDAGDIPKMVGGYENVIEKTRAYAAYYAMNVSSPNTAKLRDTPIGSLAEQTVRLCGDTPLFVKISPDMSDDDLRMVVQLCKDLGVAAVIATNTTMGRAGVETSRHANEEGGLSGMPLFQQSLRCIEVIRAENAELPIVGVGGLWNSDDANAMFKAGATALQFYTALFHQGPMALRNISGG